MTASPSAALTAPNHPLTRKLSNIGVLTDGDVQALIALPLRTADLAPDQDIVRDGDRPSRCCLVLEGFACRYKLIPRGKRQILSFHVRGDLPDLQSLHLAVMDHTLAAVTPCKVAFIDHDDLRMLLRDHPRLCDLFWRDTLIDAAIFREWMMGLGRRNAFGRMAHLFCELHARQEAVDLATPNAFPMPLTQEKLADALGLSAVHVNRTLQELRAAGLVVTTDGVVQVPNRAALAAAGEFDPSYLHMGPSATHRVGYGVGDVRHPRHEPASRACASRARDRRNGRVGGCEERGFRSRAAPHHGLRPCSTDASFSGPSCLGQA